MKQFIATWYGAITMSLIFILAGFGARLITKNDKTNEIVITASAYGPGTGYEKQEGYVKVSASWNKAWNDAKKEGNSIYIWLSVLLSLGLPLIYVAMYNGSGSKSAPAWALFAIMIVILVVPYIKPTSLKGNVKYETKICEKEYEANKETGFDYLFPDSTESNVKLDDFLKTCK